MCKGKRAGGGEDLGGRRQLGGKLGRGGQERLLKQALSETDE